MAPRDDRTHYQVLGVPTSASTEQIRRAHRQLARVLHPDRQGGASPAERALAERRMREVNAAWTALSDPARRRDYDRALLAQQSPVGSSPPRSEHRRPPTVAEDPDAALARARMAEVDPDEPDLPPGQFWLLRRGPVVAAVVVAVFLFVVTAYAGTGGDTPVSAPSRPADCVRTDEVEGAVRVTCDAPNDGRIVTTVGRADDCPGATEPVRVDARIHCITNDPTLRSNLPASGS